MSTPESHSFAAEYNKAKADADAIEDDDIDGLLRSLGPDKKTLSTPGIFELPLPTPEQEIKTTETKFTQTIAQRANGAALEIAGILGKPGAAGALEGFKEKFLAEVPPNETGAALEALDASLLELQILYQGEQNQETKNMEGGLDTERGAEIDAFRKDLKNGLEKKAETPSEPATERGRELLEKLNTDGFTGDDALAQAVTELGALLGDTTIPEKQRTEDYAKLDPLIRKKLAVNTPAADPTQKNVDLTSDDIDTMLGGLPS